MFLERRTMILQYRISNYMSIGHMVEFKMISRRTQLETTREKLGVLYKSVLLTGRGNTPLPVLLGTEKNDEREF